MLASQNSTLKTLYSYSHRAIEYSFPSRNHLYHIQDAEGIKQRLQGVGDNELLDEERRLIAFITDTLDDHIEEADYIELARLSLNATVARLSHLRNELLDEHQDTDGAKLMIVTNLLSAFQDILDDFEDHSPQTQQELQRQRRRIQGTLSLMNETIHVLFTNDSNLAALQDESTKLAATDNDKRFPLT